MNYNYKKLLVKFYLIIFFIKLAHKKQLLLITLKQNQKYLSNNKDTLILKIHQILIFNPIYFL